ncbi:MAG: heparinase II/III family protein, partial [Bacteroidetes bacterium]|nr:heparinase II/III family protein [Bacteroidota bacterium]
SGEHDGYSMHEILSRRHIVFVKPEYWFILDELESGADGNQLSWFFHTPEVLMNSAGGYRTFKEPGLQILPVTPGLVSRRGMGWAASTSDRTPGATELASWCSFEQVSSIDSTHRFPVLLIPFEARPMLVSTRQVSDRHFVVMGESYEDHFCFAGGPYRDEELTIDAQFVWIRLEDDGRTRFAIVDGASVIFRDRVLWESVERGSHEGELELRWSGGSPTETD